MSRLATCLEHLKGTRFQSVDTGRTISRQIFLVRNSFRRFVLQILSFLTPLALQATAGSHSRPDEEMPKMLAQFTSRPRRVFDLASGLFVVLVLWRLGFLHIGPDSWAAVPQPHNLKRIAKVSMLYGKPNPLYERALRSHERHAQRWHYPMHVLRRDIATGFWNKPNYLLSLVVQELAKPTEERTEWFMWVDGDSIILNSAIPAELFIPPSDLKNIHMVASRDENGLNTGIIFLHVHAWTVSMLVEAIAYPMYAPDVDLGRNADQQSMAILFNKTTGGPEGDGYADGLVYLPRSWINPYERSHGYEGDKGSFLVHFPGLEDDERFPRMAGWLQKAEITPSDWHLSLQETRLVNETEQFWVGVRNATMELASAKYKVGKMPNETESEQQAVGEVQRAVISLQDALQQHADEQQLVRDQVANLMTLTKAME